MARKRDRKKRGRTQNKHHIRPKSRGGMDDAEHPGNEKRVSIDDVHTPFNVLFLGGNERLNEVVRLLLTEWETICPHREKGLPHTDLERMKKRIKAWNRLFGKRATRISAVKKIIRLFAKTQDDKRLVRKTLQDCRKARKLSQEEFDDLMRLMGRIK